MAPVHPIFESRFTPMQLYRWLVTLAAHFLLAMLSFASTEHVLTVFSIGDSTMADKPIDAGNPERGWCQALKTRVAANVRFENHAVNGRSSRSFRTEGRWQVVLDRLQPGDWVLIQFGHNDQKVESPERYSHAYTGYREHLSQYVRETRAKGAFPLLMTPIVRRNFNESGTLVDTHGAYPLVVRLLALELQVPFVDMQLLTERKLIELGPEQSRHLHLVYEPGEHPFFPDGKADNTHLSPQGAECYAKLFLDAIREQNLPLAELFIP